MIRNVYMTHKIDDYAVTLLRPNVHFVLESGKEFTAPIYSSMMYEHCEDFGADKDTMKEIDRLYAEFLESLRNLEPDDPLKQYLIRRCKYDAEYARILGL